MKTFLTFLWILISINTIFAQTKGDQLFAEDVLHEIRIESDVSDLLDVMFNNYFLEFPGDYSYLPATVMIDGQVIDSVGVRVKGGISAFEEKKPLKLDFNEFIAGQEYDQIRKVNLHNAVLDKSMQRETISYEVLRYAGLKTPRTAYAQVYINDELQGLYTLVEQIDKTFLNNYFADENGALYKTKECEVRLISDEGTMEPYNKLLETLNNFSGTALKDTLDKILDTEALLRSLAVQNVMNTVDNM